MSSASRFRCNSMHRFGSRSLKQALNTGFLGRSLSRRRRPSEAMERLEQRSGPAPPDHGPVPGCPTRLPEPSRHGDARPGAVRASPRRPARAAPKVRKGTSTPHLLASATPQSSERGPLYRALSRYEPGPRARRSGRRHKDERPHAHSVNQRPGQRASQGQHDATPRLRRAPRREPGRGHPAS